MQTISRREQPVPPQLHGCGVAPGTTFRDGNALPAAGSSGSTPPRPSTSSPWCTAGSAGACNVDGGGDENGAPDLPREGDVIGGKYRLERRLGEGGMGVVYEAVHVRLAQSVAIKFLLPELMASPDAVARFEREARASARIHGPHVVHVLDVDTDAQGRPYMVMELLRGRDLEAELRARGALPIAEAVDWTLQACAAVGEAHAAGIVHRDLKPSNLFLADEAGTRVLKVLDFGISNLAWEGDALGSPPGGAGTPIYMSPEQVRSSGDVGPATDIWSLGVILYELLAGAPPFHGTTTAAVAAIVADAMPCVREVCHDVPEELERALRTSLARSPADRFPDAEAFGAALMPFASAEGIAGPFSLRPSQRAFENATTAMARAPLGVRASDPCDLLRLPTSVADPAAVDPPLWTVLRTFMGTMAIGVGLATAVALLAPGVITGAHRTDVVTAVHGSRLEGARVLAARDSAAHPSSPRVVAEEAPRDGHADWRKPSGSDGVGGKSMRRSSEP